MRPETLKKLDSDFKEVSTYFMSLRVLLADESASIRKVFEMGLQDYGADVKSVHNGLDVIEVAENYQPHIIFADILLQKKSGYEVSQEVQGHESLKNVPVILMWSSFMELDQKRYKSSGANGELEKPFEVDTMRNLIQKLVDLTKSQKISEFLEFPENIKTAFVEGTKEPQQPTPPATHSDDKTLETAVYTIDPNDEDSEFIIVDEETMAASDITSVTDAGDSYSGAENSSIFNMQTEDAEFDMNDLENISVPGKTQQEILDISSNDDWTAKPLSDQSYQPPAKNEPDSEKDQFQSMNLQSGDKLNLDDFLYKADDGKTPPPTPALETTNHQATTPTPAPAKYDALSSEEAEHIIRQETRKYLKTFVTQEMPDLLQKIIKEELKLILAEEVALKTSNQNP